MKVLESLVLGFFIRDLIDSPSLSLERRECEDMVRVMCYMQFTLKKISRVMEVDSQEREVDHFDLLSTKPFLARVYPSRFSQIFLSSLLRSQLRMKNTILCKKTKCKAIKQCKAIKCTIKQLQSRKL